MRTVWLAVVVTALVAGAAGVVAGILVTRSDDDLEAKYGVVGVSRSVAGGPAPVYEPKVIYRDSGSIARVEGYFGCSTQSQRFVVVNPTWFREYTNKEAWLGRAEELCD